ncbi:MAG: diacylglycerol kinase family lipid kinase [Bacillota bacterium]|nr:diacylglycerol kinase family lipid kinase [Bacillota bacterium]
MKHLFIVNPAAGKGKALNLIAEIKQAFKETCEDYTIEITEKPGHATEIVRRYAQNGSYRIYSLGGDGTLNEVLNGIAGSDSSLAVIPCGSGNDFIKSISSDKDIHNLIHKTIHGKEKLIDLAKVNDKYFANISSMGFDAEVVYNTVKTKKLPLISGKLAYILGVLLTLLRFKSYNLRILIDGEPIEQRSLLVAVANGKYYGGGMMPVPEARLDDGILDICLISKMHIFKILMFFSKFIKGKHGGIEGVSFYKGKKIEIKCDEYIILNLDGEILRVKEACFEIIPQGLSIIVPE